MKITMCSIGTGICWTTIALKEMSTPVIFVFVITGAVLLLTASAEERNEKARLAELENWSKK